MFRLYLKGLLIIIFVFIFCDLSEGQEIRYRWYAAFSFRYGGTHTFQADDFFNTYNNPYSFPRPALSSDETWPSYEPFEKEKTLGWEVHATIKDRIVIGLMMQNDLKTEKDKIYYRESLSIGNLQGSYDITESYKFEASLIPFITFLDYRIMPESPIVPVIGMGIGFGVTGFKWSWAVSGTKPYTTEKFSGDQIWYQNTDVNFILQPRARIELNIGRKSTGEARIFNAIYLQVDYIYCKGEYDVFKKFRSEVLSGYSMNSVPDEVKKLYDKYEFRWGGLQIMLGIEIRFMGVRERISK